MSRPTREELIDALVMSPLSDTAGTDMRPFEQTADAVLALYADQPTRDDISDAIEHSGIAISTSDAEQAADAVLALIRGGDE